MPKDTKKLKCYLAHASLDRDYVKKYIEPKLKTCFEVINPLDVSSWEEENDRFEKEPVSDDLVDLSHEIVGRDISSIADSDYLVAFVKSFSIGMFMEIALAYEDLSTPVIAIVPNKKYRNHSWLLVFTDEIYGSVDELIEAHKQNI